MTYIDDLTTARDQIAANIKAITVNPKPSYMVKGQTVSWGEYLMQLTTALNEVRDLIAKGQGPFELTSQVI